MVLWLMGVISQRCRAAGGGVMVRSVVLVGWRLVGAVGFLVVSVECCVLCGWVSLGKARARLSISFCAAT